MKKTIAYLRVSTDEQANCGTSLENQETRIRAYAEALSLDLYGVHSDPGVSAKTLNRPKLQKIIEWIKQGKISTLIVHKLDRLTRSVADLGTLVDLFNKYDVTLISVSESLDTSSAAGRMFINMLGVLSQWERETIGERTCSALGGLRAAGKVYGPRPYGYDIVQGHLLDNPLEQHVLHLMNGLRSGGVSYQKIAKNLNALGAKTRDGGKWAAGSVYSVLNSKKQQDLTPVG